MTAGGEVRVRTLPIEFGFIFFPFFLFFFFPTFTIFHDQSNTPQKQEKCEETRKGNKEQFASLDFWITGYCLTRGVHVVSNMI